MECKTESKQTPPMTADHTPSKYKSPPPKPPRRRYTDQLPSSGTLPSCWKKYEIEQDSKDPLSSFNTCTSCESLPADWTASLISDCSSEKLPSLRNSPPSDSQIKTISFYSKSHLPSPICNQFSLSYTKSLLENETNKSTNLKLPRDRAVSYPLQGKTCDASTKESSKSVPDYFHVSYYTKKGISDVATNNKKHKLLELKSFSREYHRRHHSEPVLPFIDKSKFLNGIHKSTIRSHSFLGCSTSEPQTSFHKSFYSSYRIKELQCLYEELKNSKDVNDKLWQFLCTSQENLENALKKTFENCDGLSIADLLSSLYHSQKSKECAIEDRMNIILEERDCALKELEDIVVVIARSFQDKELVQLEECSDKKIKELLKEIESTYYPAKLLQQQRILLAYLYHSKELKQDRISHELKLAGIEKDNLLEKVVHLEEELKSFKAGNEMTNSDTNYWENSLLGLLRQVIQQRDSVISFDKTKNLLALNSKSPNQADSLTVAKPSKSLKSLHNRSEENNSSKKSLQTVHSDSNNYPQFSLDPSEELKLLKGEIMVLSKALELEVGRREEAEKKCLRFERLVTVLQKKINGQNFGIPV